MGLPFLKDKKHTAGLIIQNRAADGSHDSVPEDHQDQGLETCGEDLIRAITSKDAKGVAAAMRAAFAILESEPHEEAGEPEQEGGI